MEIPKKLNETQQYFSKIKIAKVSHTTAYLLKAV